MHATGQNVSGLLRKTKLVLAKLSFETSFLFARQKENLRDVVDYGAANMMMRSNHTFIICTGEMFVRKKTAKNIFKFELEAEFCNIKPHNMDGTNSL